MKHFKYFWGTFIPLQKALGFRCFESFFRRSGGGGSVMSAAVCFDYVRYVEQKQWLVNEVKHTHTHNEVFYGENAVNIH
jgi:hypothetical protein